MTSGSDWTSKVGGTWAREWERTDRSFGLLTDCLIDEARKSDFSHALDIGCGAGETSLRLAASGEGRVTGIDISEDLLSVARTRAEGVANLEFVEADAAHWQPASGAIDLLVSRHGVMFFPDPVSAFASLRTNAAENARIVFSCFRSKAENGWLQILNGVFGSDEPEAESTEPGPFAFGNRDHVQSILAAAGWNGIEFDAIDYSMVAGGGDDPVGDAVSYFLRIGPAARKIAELEGNDKERAIERLREVLSEHCSDGQVALPSAAWVVTARA